MFVSSTSSVHFSEIADIINNVAEGGDGGGLYLDRSVGTKLDGDGILFDGNLAHKAQHNTQVVVGQGRGGGLFALQAQIGSVNEPINLAMKGNKPSGLHSIRSSMFLKAPMERYADAIVVADGDFPFPVPLCESGKFFPYDESDPWGVLKGKYEIITGSDVCYTCPDGYAASAVGSTKCTKCALGEHQSKIGQDKCNSCGMGMFSNASGLKICYRCPIGWATGVLGSIRCSKCQRGEVQDMVGQASCKSCSEGQYSDTPGATKCKSPEPGTIAVGGSSTVQVANGWYRECKENGICDVSLPCPIGKYGSTETEKKDRCMECPAGWSSFSGSLSCVPCSKGKFTNKEGSPCEDCKQGLFQPQDQVASIECKSCPLGWKTEQEGESACKDKGFTKPEDCSDAQYLNDTSTNQSSWKCVACPTGGYCSGSITASTMLPLFGWWAIPSSNNKFSECLYHPACPGAPNPKLQGKYLYEGKDPADLPVGSTQLNCAFHLGFRNQSRVCHTCANGYRRGSANTCILCPGNEAANWVLIFLGFLIILSGCLLLVYSTIKSKGKQQISEMILKILLNYFQVANMARVFPLHWPPEIESLFDFLGAFSTVGGNLLNPDCVSTTSSSAELFYSKQIVFASFPIIIMFVSFFVWYMYATCVLGIDFFAKRLTPSSSTAKDSFIITVGTLLYLLFPTLIGGAFQLFDCRAIENPDVKWLYVDLEEQCYVGRHFAMMMLFGVSQLLLYVLGFPCLLLFFLIRNSGRLHKHATKIRYSMFFASYKKSRYYWEIVLSLRKISIVALGVFGPIVGPVRQSQIAQFILLVCIVLEIVGKPYTEETKRHKILNKLETTVLMVLWGNFGGGTMIYQSIEVGDGVSASLVTILTVFMNVVMIIALITLYMRSVLYENRSTKLVQRVASFHFARKVIGMNEYDTANNFVVGSDASDDSDIVGIELVSGGVGSDTITDTIDSTTSLVNPLFEQKHENERKTSARNNWRKLKKASQAVDAFKRNNNCGDGKKRLKRLSAVLKSRSERSDEKEGLKESDDADKHIDEEDKNIDEILQDEESSGESVLIVEEEDVEVLFDEETGEWYSYNLKTGETKWLIDESEKNI